ncbi:HD domain-containing protein [Sporanaerobacter acetigenes]|uniref:HD domain-containing protein n=1 Tax=Sporanaerobacter acetigenes TaxID=165813 RepID=UPI0010443676|nr:HD domain-containing protein [Sporanaerobacter acetigenes]
MNYMESFAELFNSIKRDGKESLLKYLENSGYFTAPCSSQYHLCKEGGLLEHSVNVAELALRLSEALSYSETEKIKESIIICGLFHDLGKASYYNKANYVPNILKSGEQSKSKPYETNKELLNIPHEISSIHILSKFIQLTEEETFAILYHNGLYTSVGYGLKGNERPLQMILHFADMWASRVVEIDNLKKEENILF